MSTRTIVAHMQSLIDAGAEFQVGLRGMPQTLGPAKVEVVNLERLGIFDAEPLYRMMQPAQMQTDKNSRPRAVFLPCVFSADDVLVVLEAPVNADGDKAVVPIGSNGRTASGLVIPGH